MEIVVGLLDILIKKNKNELGRWFLAIQLLCRMVDGCPYKGSGWLAMVLILLELQPSGMSCELMIFFSSPLRESMEDCGCRWRRYVAKSILIGHGSLLH